MDREQKTAVVEGLASELKDASAIFAVDYRGISVPQAAEELLLRIGAHSLGQLPAMEIDMQTKSVATGSEVDELVSVFLTPDQEQSENHGFGVTHSDRAQRLDGVLRFEPG